MSPGSCVSGFEGLLSFGKAIASFEDDFEDYAGRDGEPITQTRSLLLGLGLASSEGEKRIVPGVIFRLAACERFGTNCRRSEEGARLLQLLTVLWDLLVLRRIMLALHLMVLCWIGRRERR